MTTLDEFGVEGEDPPVIKKKGRVLVDAGNRTRTAGWHGPTNRGGVGFVTARDSHEHRLRALDAYAISKSVLRKLALLEAVVILVVETDTDAVFEFTFEDYVEYGEVVPEKFNANPRDPQRYVPRTKAYAEWPNHRGDVYVPRGEDGPELTHD